jgi:serine protease Do
VDTGVIVAARAADATQETGLKAGDVIHALNGTKIDSLDGLRTAVGRLKPGDAVALQIERDEILMYVSFELE